MLDVAMAVNWLDRLADVYEQNKENLTELDAAIGDADHGINMARGFSAVRQALAATPPAGVGAACKAASMALIKHVGGASGPLYGTLFLKMAAALPGEAPVPLAAFADALDAGVAGIKQMGKSEAGQKTMLDAWTPAMAALREALASGKSDKDALADAAAAAEAGMKATIPMLATKGRASYLGERSVGHQDPGATSTWLMLKTLAETAG